MDKVKGRLRPVLVFAGAAVLVLVGVTVYVLLQRLSDETLAVLATVACAGGAATPGGLLALYVLLRRLENGQSKRDPWQGYQYTQPQIMVMPPMALPQPSQGQPSPAATWEVQRQPRHFVVVGGDEG